LALGLSNVGKIRIAVLVKLDNLLRYLGAVGVLAL
jgi:hypothetical protein